MKFQMSLTICLILFSSNLHPQNRYLLHLNNKGVQEAIPLRRGEKAATVISRMEHGAPMRISNTDGLPDTLKNYASASDLSTNFGFTHQDVAFEYFVPPIDGIILEFWWFELKGGDIDKGLVRAWNANPALLTIAPTAVEATGNMGWYIQSNDGDGGVTPYRSDATDTTFHPGVGGAAGISFDPLGIESQWKPGGVTVTLDTSLDASTGVWNHIKLSDFSTESFNVVRGRPFGFTIQNSSPAGGANGRMEILSATATAPYPSLKFYETARTGNNDPGWWIRAYYWGQYVVIDYTESPYFYIRFERLTDTYKTTPRTVHATVSSSEGVKSVLLYWKKSSSETYELVTMQKDSNKTYSGIIPGAAVGDTIYYFGGIVDMNNDTSASSKAYSYSILSKQSDYLCLYNCRSPIKQLTPKQAAGLYLSGIENFDLWDVGKNSAVGLPDVLAMYDKVAEITGDGSTSGADVITPVGAWLGTGTPSKPKLYFLSDQDHGWFNNFNDTTFDDDNVHAKYFGVKTLGPQDYPYYLSIPNVVVNWPWNIIVDSSANNDSLTAFINRYTKANNVTLWYHPSYELGSQVYNWMDEIKPTADARVLFRDTSYGKNRVIGVRKTAKDSSWATVFLAFDYLSMDFRSDTSLTPTTDPKYTWIFDAGGNPAAKFFETPFLTSVKRVNNGVPEQFALQQNYPNPFNPTTHFQFSIGSFSGGSPYGQFVSLKIFNILGQEVATLVSEQLRPGHYTRTWDASGFSSGIYFYRLTAGSFSQTRKLALTK